MKTITYVKYPNRRLYETDSSSYVTFPNLKTKILEGYDIVVLDNKTKEDVTREVLVSIIMEETFEDSPIFSEDLMKMIIRFYGHPLQDVLKSALDQNIKLMTDFWASTNFNKTNEDK